MFILGVYPISLFSGNGMKDSLSVSPQPSTSHNNRFEPSDTISLELFSISQLYSRRGLRVTGNQEDKKDCGYDMNYTLFILYMYLRKNYITKNDVQHITHKLIVYD